MKFSIIALLSASATVVFASPVVHPFALLGDRAECEIAGEYLRVNLSTNSNEQTQVVLLL